MSRVVFVWGKAYGWGAAVAKTIWQSFSPGVPMGTFG